MYKPWWAFLNPSGSVLEAVEIDPTNSNKQRSDHEKNYGSSGEGFSLNVVHVSEDSVSHHCCRHSEFPFDLDDPETWDLVLYLWFLFIGLLFGSSSSFTTCWIIVLTVPGLSRRSVDLLNARSGHQLYIGRVKWETDLKIRQDFVFDIARVII